MSWRIIDAYCGIGPWATRDKLLPVEPAETLAVLDQCGIEKALVYGNLVHQVAAAEDVNEYVEAQAAACGRLLPAFVISPQAHKERSGVGDVAVAMRRAGAKAAWLWPQAGRQAHGLWTWLAGDVYDFCCQCRVPLLMQIDAATPDQVHTLCQEYPKLTLVLAGLDYRADTWLVPLLRLHPRLHACCGPTYIPPLGPEQFVNRFGAGRLIFGSGLPFHSPGGLVTHFAYANIRDEDKAAIFAGNIERLMGEVRL